MLRLFSVTLLVIFLIIAVATAGWLYNQQKKVSLEYTIASQRWAQLRLTLETKLAQTEEEVTNLDKNVQQLNMKIDNFEIDTKSLKNKLSFFEKERKNLSEKLETALYDNRRLQRRIARFSFEARHDDGIASDDYIAKLIKDKASLQVMAEGLKGRLERREKELNNILREKKDIQQKLSDVDCYQKELKSKLENAEKIQDKLAQKLIERRRAHLRTSKESESIKRERIALEGKLINLTQERMDSKNRVRKIENKLDSLILERDSLLRQVSSLNKRLEDKIVQVGSVKRGLEDVMRESKQIALSRSLGAISSVELPPIIVKSQEASALSQDLARGFLPGFHDDIYKQLLPRLPETNLDENEAEWSALLGAIDLKGKILLVNRQQQFVVINLGKNNRIRHGMIFDVYRNDQRIGSLRVVEVRSNLSAADIIRTSEDIIRKNDIVKLR